MAGNDQRLEASGNPTRIHIKRPMALGKRETAMSGTTLIEALVFLFVFSVITLAFYSAISAGTRYIVESKNRLGAAAIANERMEIVRNLDYDDIGTTTGIPSGVLSQQEAISRNGRQYYVFAFVQYVDDPLDGTLSGSPKDSIPTDYKRVRIKVAWENDIDTDRAVTVISDFPPEGIETSAGGGTLSVNVIDTQGAGIPQAQVNIKNSYSGIDITTLTDDSGNVTLPGAPAGTRRYVISVAKDGYLSVSTLPPYPTTSYDPVDVNASVVAKAVNSKTIITDKLSSFELDFKDPFGAAIPDVGFSLTGGRVMGYAVSYPYDPVYYYDETGLEADSDGKKSFDGMSYGSYRISLDGTGHVMLRTGSDLDSGNDAIEADPGADSSIDAVLADESLASLLVVAEDSSDSVPIQNASVELSDSSGYDVTVTTDKYGQAYFPTELPALAAGTYSVKVTASGYGDGSDSVTVGSGLVSKEMKLSK